MVPVNQPVGPRFWEMAGLPDAARSECWPWNGANNQGGYGRISVNNRAEQAHRVAYMLVRVVDARGIRRCQRCNRAACRKYAAKKRASPPSAEAEV
jgi:hypothetical protein